jgi:endonuclease III
MDDLKLQNYITDWLMKYHDKSAHQDILERTCTIGSKSKPWTEAVQSYVRRVSLQEPRKAEIKRACRMLLDSWQNEGTG